MKKMSKKFALISMASSLLVSGSIASDVETMQYNSTLTELETMVRAQKGFDEIKCKYEKISEKNEKLLLKSNERVEAILLKSPEEAKEIAFHIAAKMDKKSEEVRQRVLDVVESKEVYKNNFSYVNELKALEERFNVQNVQYEKSKNNLWREPLLSYQLNFLGKSYVGHGHYLFFSVMETYHQHKKACYAGCLSSHKGLLEIREKEMIRSKNTFMKYYGRLSAESMARVDLVAKMKGVKMGEQA